MNSILRCLGLALAVLGFVPSSARAEPASCKVTVVTTMKSGKVKKRVFNTKAGTKVDCAEDAQLHTTNFFPPKIKTKDVEYQFGDETVKVRGDAK